MHIICSLPLLPALVPSPQIRVQGLRYTPRVCAILYPHRFTSTSTCMSTLCVTCVIQGSKFNITPAASVGGFNTPTVIWHSFAIMQHRSAWGNCQGRSTIRFLRWLGGELWEHRQTPQPSFLLFPGADAGHVHKIVQGSMGAKKRCNHPSILFRGTEGDLQSKRQR